MRSCRGTHITMTANCKCSLWIAGIFVFPSLRLLLSGKMLLCTCTFNQVHKLEYQSYCLQVNLHILALTVTCHSLIALHLKPELLYFQFLSRTVRLTYFLFYLNVNACHWSIILYHWAELKFVLLIGCYNRKPIWSSYDNFIRWYYERP